MNRTKYLAWPAYVVALALVAIPLAEAVLRVWPLQPGVTRWRFGAVGVLSQAMMTPLLGLLLVFAVALLLEKRTLQRVLAVVSGVGVLALVGVVGLFLLDALEMRAQVNPQVKRAFDLATLLALGKYALTGAALLAFGIAGWLASRGERGSGKGKAPARKAGNVDDRALFAQRARHAAPVAAAREDGTVEQPKEQEQTAGA